MWSMSTTMRWLARRAFPVFVFGLLAFLYYRPTIELNEDLFEPANSGLLIQQFFDFGRLPFIETFNGHGLSDSLMGFVWRAVHGSRDESWVHWYSFVDGALFAPAEVWVSHLDSGRTWHAGALEMALLRRLWLEEA